MELAQIRTGDGRALEYAITGPDDGPVLLFHHGTPGSVHQDRFLARAVHARGWRLLSYSRAGYGGSSRSRGRSVADVVPDCAALLDAVGAERALVAGASGGGPHALACAAGLPGRVAAALCIAGVGPSGAQGLEFLAGMGQDNVDEFGAGAQGEDALRGYLEPQADQLRNATPTEIVTSLASILPDVDSACLSGELGEDFAESLRHGLASSADGWLDDDLAFLRPWGFALDTITVPVAIWQGEADLMVPFAHGRWLSEHVPTARVHLEANEGHLSLAVGAVDRMLAELAELAGWS